MYQCCLGSELPPKKKVTLIEFENDNIHFKVFDKRSKVVVAETNDEEEAINYVLEGNFDYQWFPGRVE